MIIVYLVVCMAVSSVVNVHGACGGEVEGNSPKQYTLLTNITDWLFELQEKLLWSIVHAQITPTSVTSERMLVGESWRESLPSSNRNCAVLGDM